MTHRLWDPLLPLADKYTLITYDFPGHGETPLPAGAYGVEDLSNQLAAVLRREGIAKAHIGGLSLGGLVAQHFAATYPDMTDHLILADTTPRYPEPMREMWVTRAAAARRDGVASLVPNLLKIWFTEPFVAADPPPVRFVRDTLSACDGEGYARACEALRAAELRPLAPKITAPTLVICGENESDAFRNAAQWLRITSATRGSNGFPPPRIAPCRNSPNAGAHLFPTSSPNVLRCHCEERAARRGNLGHAHARYATLKEPTSP